MQNILKLFVVSLAILACDQIEAKSKITINLNKYEWYPLDKTKMAIFQEIDHQNGYNYEKLFRGYPELNFHSFRMLLSQGRRTQTFNNPEQFRLVENKVKVSVDDDIKNFVHYMQKNRIMPVFTLFEIPSSLRDNPSDHRRAIPQNMELYTNHISNYVQLCKKSNMTMYWEVWNEPENGNFLFGDNKIADYMRFYKATAPAVRNADSDALILGPACATSKDKINLFTRFFKDIKKDASLMPDVFTFHFYGREGLKRDTDIPDELNMARRFLGNKYNHVPMMITEYEYYQAGDGKNATRERENRETPVGAATLLTDMNFFSKQVDVEYVHWNRLAKNSSNGRKGGVFDENGNILPHYYARLAFNRLPINRVELDLGTSRLRGTAAMDDDLATILLWSHFDISQDLEIDILGIREKFPDIEEVRVSRLFATESNPKGEFTTQILAINALNNLEFNGAGFMMIEIANNYENVDSLINVGMNDVHWIRNYKLCEREQSGRPTGNYAITNTKEWSVMLGTRKEGSISAGGFKLSNLPSTINIESQVITPHHMPHMAIQIIYNFEGKEYPVILSSTEELKTHINNLPWKISKGDIEGKFSPSMSINLDRYAPKGWCSSERKASLIFIAKGIDKDTQVITKITNTKY